jgi:hypothetical protein
MYPKLKINVYFIFLYIGDLTFGITLVHKFMKLESKAVAEESDSRNVC